MNSAEFFVKCLENEGVKYIFGLPGEENLEFVEAVRKSDIELIVARHEQAAGFMAATWGRLTGDAGVAMSTLGPGATNLATSAAYATLGAMPMVMITGQKPIKESKQGKFQILDVVNFMKPLTKYSRQIVGEKTIPASIREGFRQAQNERPGAAHIEFPEDIADEAVEEDLQPISADKIRRPAGEKKAIKKAVDMIESADRPLLLVGAGANRKLVSNALSDFIDETGIPFFNTQMGKGVVDERHPLYLGCAALSSKDYIHCAVENSDLIINVGHDVVEKPPFFMKQNDKRKVIHVNYSSAEVDGVYFPHWEVVGDVGNSVWQMNQRIEPQDSWDFDYFLEVKNKKEEQINKKKQDNSFPMIPQRIVSKTREVVPEDGIVALDNGMYKLWFARNYKAYQRNTLLLDNALASMGAGLPSAIGAKFAKPDQQVLAVCGDGGFMMNGQEIETAVRNGIDITVMILNDSGYGMIKWKQKKMELEDYGLDFANPDFVKYAESFGAEGYRIESIEEFQETLDSCLNKPGVDIIDVPIDYSENQEVFNKQLQERTCIL